jgi:hypothetical protein
MSSREKYLARQRKYNTSSKGQKRNRRYEDAHPERKLRWEPARNALHFSKGNNDGIPNLSSIRL